MLARVFYYRFSKFLRRFWDQILKGASDLFGHFPTWRPWATLGRSQDASRYPQDAPGTRSRRPRDPSSALKKKKRHLVKSVDIFPCTFFSICFIFFSPEARALDGMVWQSRHVQISSGTHGLSQSSLHQFRKSRIRLGIWRISKHSIIKVKATQ